MSKFKVLWIDDEKNKIQLEMDNLEQLLTEYGFQPEIKYLESINTLEIKPDNVLGADLKARVYDLIFIDFKLKGILGSEIIGEMRIINNIYTDIVFYSSDGEDLKQKVKDSFDKGILEYIDDVHIVILDDGDYYEKIEKVVNKVIGSWYTPSAFRRIVLDKTCKFENKALTMLSECCCGTGLTNFKNEFDALFPGRLKGKMLTDFNLITCASGMLNFFKDNSHIFNWKLKADLLKKFILTGVYSGIDETTLNLLNAIFIIRNNISHNKVVIDNSCIIVYLKTGIQSYNEVSVKKIINDINTIDLLLSTVNDY